jgi:hypothetical protein
MSDQPQQGDRAARPSDPSSDDLQCPGDRPGRGRGAASISTEILRERESAAADSAVPVGSAAATTATAAGDGNDMGVAVRIVLVASTIAALIGAATLLGWALEVPFLRAAAPGQPGMVPITAVALLLASAALLASSDRASQWMRGAGIAAALTIIGMGVAALGGYVLGWNTAALDLLLFP